MRKIAKLAMALTGAVVLGINFSGCMSRAELNDRVIIEGLGLDREGDEYSLTVMVLNTESSEEVMPPKVISTSGGSVLECFENLARNTGKEIMLSDNRFIIINKAAAERADEVLSYFDGSLEARPDTLLYVAEGAGELLSNEDVLEAMSAEDIAMISGEYSSGVTPCDYKEFKASDSSGIYDVSVPILRLNDDGSRIVPDGSALFKNGRMSGTMTEEETKILSILSDNADGTVINMAAEDGKKIPIEIVSSSSDSGVSFENDNFIYAKDIKVEVKLPQGSTPDKKLLTEIEEFLKESCIKTVEKATKTCDSDILRIGKKAQNSYYTEFTKLTDWHEELKGVKLKFTVTINNS